MNAFNKYKSIKYKSIYLLSIALIILFIVISPYGKDLLIRTIILGLASFGVYYLYKQVGELSFGHASFFGIGAYSYALFGGSNTFSEFLYVFVATLLIVLIAGIIISFFAVRLFNIYFTLFMLCLSEGFKVVCSRLYGTTGGDNGIQGIPVPSFITKYDLIGYTLILLIFISYYLYLIISNSKLGKSINAQKQSLRRSSSLGLNTFIIRWKGMVISTIPTGIAGFLLAMHDQAVHPDLLGWIKSGDMILVVFIGGINNILGVYFGASLLEPIKTVLASLTDYWSFILGVLVIIVSIRHSNNTV